MKPKYFERDQARIVFYVVQQAIDTGAKYIYMTDVDEIIAYKEPMRPSDIELSKSELVLVLPEQKETCSTKFKVDTDKVINTKPQMKKEQ